MTVFPGRTRQALPYPQHFFVVEITREIVPTNINRLLLLGWDLPINDCSYTAAFQQLFNTNSVYIYFHFQAASSFSGASLYLPDTEQQHILMPVKALVPAANQ